MTTEHSLAGILEPVFAIRTEDDLGLGDTAGVRQMVDWCARHRLNVFQTLPINETSGDNSPYNAISSLAIEPGTISVSPRDLPDLAPAELQRRARPGLLAELRHGPVNYAKSKALKRTLLEAAFARFLRQHWRRNTARAGAFRRFLRVNAGWLSHYALFRVLMEENGGAPAWEHWPEWHRSPRRAGSWLLSLPEKRREALARRRLFFSYVQWIAYGQWRALKTYSAARGVSLMGDIPFGVGRCSADVWANPDLFDLDWSGGAPPESVFASDPFTAKWGQNWGIPNYRWDQLRRRGFDWWRARVGQVGQVFHLYRIDHVLGFFRIYSFPWTPGRDGEFLPLDERQAAAKTGGRLPGFKEFPDDTPEHRNFNQRQGEEILRVVLEASGDTTVIAEDLGVVPDYVPATLRRLGIPGFRIPAFCRERDGSYSDPAKYPRLSVTQPATHDHPPLAAVWAGHWRSIDAGHNAEANRLELRRLMDFAGLGAQPAPREFTDELHGGYLRRVVGSNSWLVLVMITDLFGLTARFNRPGARSADNWTTRLDRTVAELDRDPALLAMTERFTRLLAKANRGLPS
jgi:4-alpha-glucanotransferase